MLLRRETLPLEGGVPNSSSVLLAERSVRCRISDRRGVLRPEAGGSAAKCRAASGLGLATSEPRCRLGGEVKLGVDGERSCCEVGEWTAEGATDELIESRMRWFFSFIASILLLRRCLRASAASSTSSRLPPAPPLAGRVRWLAAESARRDVDAPLSLPPAALTGLSGRLPIELRSEGECRGEGLDLVGDLAADEGLAERASVGVKLRAESVCEWRRAEDALAVRCSALEPAPLLRREPGGESDELDERALGWFAMFVTSACITKELDTSELDLLSPSGGLFGLL